MTDQGLCCLGDSLEWNGYLIDLDPARIWDPLRSKGLCFLDSMLGRINEEGAYKTQTPMVGDVGGGLLLKGFAVEILMHVNGGKKVI